METNEKVERLLADIRLKADQLMVDDEEARCAGVPDGSLPSLDSDSGLGNEDITQTEAWSLRRRCLRNARGIFRRC
jgi:hypothetical protein